MKTKTTLKIISFAIAFALALAFVTLANKNFFKKNNPQAQEKIYNFLQKDRELDLEMYEKSKTADSGDEVLANWKYHKELKFKLNTADLPDDFRYAWEKRISSDINWINFFSYFRMSNPESVLKTDAQNELFEKIDYEYGQASQEFDSVIKSYGIEYNDDGELIKK